MENKKIKAKLKMRLKGGQATAGPPVGSTLGQHRVNMMDFVNGFNQATQDRKNEDLTVHIFIHDDNTMTWRIVGPPVDELIRQALGIEKGSGKPHLDKVAQKLSQDQVKEIALKKKQDVNTDSLPAIEKMIKGSARSMGVEITD